MSRVELYERIRKDNRSGLSIRALAAKHRVHRRTVREALASATPPERKTPERVSPALGPWMVIIRAWLVADRDAPRKQRHTARRVWQRLVAEYGAQVAESTVRVYVAQVNFELDNALFAVTVPQTHGPGEEAECDFGEFMAWIDGVLVKCWMFCLRLSYSGRGFHVAFCHQAQEAFFEGHVLAFEHFGGVPAGVIRYDNLKSAVVKVLLGRDRLENERFIALRSHYGFDSFYCLPGIDGAHEKGGVEGEVGRFRRRHLVPVPRVGSLAELNELLAAGDRIDDDRRIGRRADTVGQAASTEAAWLRPLPDEPFDPAAILPNVKVDTKGRICVRQSFYSVPVRLARRTITVRLGAQALEAVADGKVVARHVRSLHKGTEDLVLDHYLEILERKPGALPGSTALAQARSSGAFGATHERFWVEARHKLGDGAGTRALIGVLLLQRRMAAQVVIEAMSAALAIGSVNPDIVAIEARRIDARRPPAPVVPIGTGARDIRPAPRLDGYDELLAAGGDR
ncbi:MAG: IS21 family transposase [Acidimicrobiia bacterium]|nr:IS21 family transposase [Acidimicrobiia bacterium]